MMWFFLLGVRLAGAYEYPVALSGGIGAAYGLDSTSYGGYLSGRALFQFSKHSLDLGYREGYFSQDPRILGGIFVGARHWLSDKWYVREGMGHHHETPLEIVKSSPVGAIIGAVEGIDHRTALEVGAGFLEIEPPSYLPLSAGLDLSMNLFFDQSSPQYYVYLQVEFALNLGKEGASIQVVQ